ncbi:MAG: hypothetical protein LBK53_05615 [Heliobacteriaceae bacterium]|jgi:hypothetical protein|nr:hypothetical protein [Heliobacteriaceae bacterium]
MKIAAINNLTFGDKNGYENPINRQRERNLAILSNTGISLLVGATAGGISTSFLSGKLKGRYWIAAAIGLGAAVLTSALTLPAKLYDTKVSAFAKEKEMGVFSVKKDTQANIYDEVNNQVQDKTVDLKEKVNNFATVSMATNGKGLMVKGV